MYSSKGSGSLLLRSPALRVPFRWFLIVSRLRPRCLAMAEIDQPCSRNAVASMSSFPVNMREVPFPRWWFGHHKPRRGATLGGG